MKKVILAGLMSVLLTACETNNRPAGGSNSTNPTPTPGASPTPGPSPDPGASPSPSPTPTPSATPAPGSGNASACFNPELLQQGTQSELSYRSTDGDSGQVLTFTDTRMVTGPATFNGEETIRTDGTTEASSAQGDTTTQTQTYNTIDTAAMRTRTHGATTSTMAQGFTTTSESVFDPPSLMRFDLAAGESYSQSYSVTTTVDTGGFGGTTTTVDNDETTTFVGEESITVPAGIFDTCRFDTASTQTVDGQSQSQDISNWFDVGSGVLIKNTAGDDMTEFTGGTVNGTAVQ